MTPHKALVGIYPPSTVKDVAESLSAPPLSETVSTAIAGDVEYRLNLIIQEAQKFMRHGKRRTMKMEDVEAALEVLNVAPLLHPPAPLPAPTFSAVYPSLAPNASGQLYYLQSEEIDLPSFIRQSRSMPVQVPVAVAPSGENKHGKTVEGGGKGVTWKAHWLAVEGVQPLIRENPAPIPGGDPSQPSSLPPQVDPAKSSSQGRAGDKQKYSLPMELQLLFQRLTSAIVPEMKDYRTTTTTMTAADGEESQASTPLPGNALPGPSSTTAEARERSSTTLSAPEQSRLAALQTLSTDPGLISLLPHLIRWHSENILKIVSDSLQPPGSGALGAAGGIAGIGKDVVGKERVMGKAGRMMLGWLVEGLGALSANEGLFIEPYVHQFLSPLLSILVSTTLGAASTTIPSEGATKMTPTKLGADPAVKYTATIVRKLAADLLGKLMGDYGKGYDTLIPRITKTLLRALHSPPPPAPAPKEMDPPQPPRYQPSPSTGRYEGALLGLRALGEQVVGAALFSDGAGLGTEGEAGGKGKGLRGFGEVVAGYGKEDAEGLVELTVAYLSEVFSVPRSTTFGDHDSVMAGGPVDESERALSERFGDVFGKAFSKEKELGERLLSL